jgi:phosphohistidine phosphatase
MRLMLLRHAKAEKGATGTADRERSLTPRGCDDAARIGAYLVHHGLVPAAAFVSPARRTRETWDAVVQAMTPPPPVTHDDRLYESRSDLILAAIRAGAGSVPTLLVIGHNPGLHDTARMLIAAGDVEARERLNEGMPTAALAVIDFPGEDWSTLHPRGGRLERFVSPRSLAAPPD